MIHYYTKPGTRVGDIVDYEYHGKIYKATVISADYYDYQYGTEGYSNGDKYFEARVRFKLEIGCTMEQPLLNNI